MSTSFDVIVIGAGGIGSAAAWRLAQRGVKVLAIDRFSPPHDHGSSHGQTRIYRRAYFEHPNYVPLAVAAASGWRELEATTNRSLLVETGLVQIGPIDGPVLRGVLESARQHSLRIDELTGADVAKRWSSFVIPAGMGAIFERSAGTLFVEACVRAQIDAARDAGVEFLFGAEVLNWSCAEEICVRTSAGEFSADRLVVAAGAWTHQLMSSLAVDLRVLRKHLFWYQCDDRRMSAADGSPAFLFELPSGVFYGFPMLDKTTVKVAEHSGGEPVDDPTEVDRKACEENQRLVEQFLTSHLPTVSRRLVDHCVCLYTMSADGNFIVDRLPDDERIVVAAGFSGHGFKFAPALGQAIADLTLEGATDLPIDFLLLARFA